MTAIVRGLTVAQRLDRLYTPEPNTGCWIWTSVVGQCGYGQIKIGDKVALAHRVSWWTANGPIPEGLQLDHVCRNRACINPAHLRLTTLVGNLTAPGSLSTASSAGKPTCARGHSRWLYRSNGHRRCAVCTGLQNARAKAKARERKRAGAAAHPVTSIEVLG